MEEGGVGEERANGEWMGKLTLVVDGENISADFSPPFLLYVPKGK